MTRWQEKTRTTKQTRGRVERSQVQGKSNRTSSGDGGRKYKSIRQQGEGVGIL